MKTARRTARHPGNCYRILIAIVLIAALLSACSPFSAGPAQPANTAAPATASAVPPTDSAAAVSVAKTGETALPATPTIVVPAAVWFTNPTDKTLVRVDPKTDQIVGQISLGGKIDPVIYEEGSVWAAQTMDNGATTLMRIDPISFAVEATIPIEYGPVTSILSAQGSLWLGIRASNTASATRQPDDVSLPGGIARVDPATNSIASYQPLNSTPTELRFFSNTLWALEQSDLVTTIASFDANTLQEALLTHTANGEDSVYRFNHFALAPSGIWATSVDQRSHYFYRVDPSTGQINSTYSAGANPDDTPTGIAASEAAIWVGLSSGTVLKVDPASGQIVSQIATKPGLTGLFLDEEGLWVENSSMAEAYHIDPDTGQLRATIPLGARPAATATPAPRQLEAPVCDAAYQTRLEAGGRATVSEDPPTANRVRETADRDGKIIGSIAPGESVQLLEGPNCTQGWIWWRVQSESTGLTGWTSEGDESGYWLVPER
jgi:hypothetical protein